MAAPDPPACVSVVIPAFNEEQAIATQIRDLTKVLDASGWTYELLVVDDGSTDRTASRAEACAARVLRLARNGGYGAALKAGISATRYEWVLITDADGTYPAGSVLDLLRAAEGADMVVGSRTGATRHIPVVRRPAKWLVRLYASLLVWRHIPDLNSGMRLIRRSALNAFWDLLPAGFSFTTTITLASLATGRRVSYVTIEYLARVGQSKIRASDFFRIFSLITRVMFRFFPRRVLALWVSLLWLAGAFLLWPLGRGRAAVASGLLCGIAVWLAGFRLDRTARLERARQP